MKGLAAPLAAVLLAVLVIASLALVLRARGRAAMEESELALARGDTALAILLAKRAAQARLPGSPYPALGYEKLASIAEAREAAGDKEAARAAYRAIVSAARSTGDTSNPHAARAREALAKLDGEAAVSSLPGPSSFARVSLALGVLLSGAGLAWLMRGGKSGWFVFAAGLIGVVTAALSG